MCRPQHKGKLWRSIGILALIIIPLHSYSANLFTLIEHPKASQTPKPTANSTDESGNAASKTEKTIQMVVMNTAALQEELVEISALPALGIPINGEDNPIYVRESVYRNASGFTVWRGVAESTPLETATILQKNGEFHGTLQLRGKTFSLRPSSMHGKHLLIEKDFTGMGCGNEGE